MTHGVEVNNEELRGRKRPQNVVESFKSACTSNQASNIPLTEPISMIPGAMVVVVVVVYMVGEKTRFGVLQMGETLRDQRQSVGITSVLSCLV